MAEATGLEAKTIHRLLEFDPASYGFRRGAELPLELWKTWIEESWMTVAPKRLSAAHRAQKS
jgi:exodeoxyribonuclease V alpha subunit